MTQEVIFLHSNSNLLFVLMSVKSRQKSSSKNIESMTRLQYSSGFGSCSTLENEPNGQLRKMKEIIHNLFELAKKELSTIYKLVLTQIQSIQYQFKQKEKISQPTLELVTEIKQHAQAIMPQLFEKLKNILIVPNLLKQNKIKTNQPMYQYSLPHLKPSPRKKQMVSTSTSLNKNQISISLMEGSINRNSVRKIRPNNVRVEDDLKFLTGDWPCLEAIRIEGKEIYKLCNFGDVKANLLRVINFANNQIHDLKCFKNANFPMLTQLNLSKNQIKILDGLQKTHFPHLIILNLSHNFISELNPLKSCQFPKLLELNLQRNRLQKLQILNTCDFPNLQILNLDQNCIKAMDCLNQMAFYRLKVLSFSYNAITSIQFVSKLSLRKLQALIGHNNKITSIEPLTHANFPILKQIVLHNNEVVDIGCVKKMNFKELTGFDLEHNKIDIRTSNCFIGRDKAYSDAKKKYPFILI